MNTGTLLKIVFWGGMAYLVLHFLQRPNEQVAAYQNDIREIQERDTQTKATEAQRVQAVKEQLDAAGFEDAALEQCIANEIALREHLIRYGKFDPFTELESLDCSRKKISNLRGIQNFVALKKLNLSGNNLSFVDPLSGLQNLESLDLSNNKGLDSLWTITSLPKLHTLNVRGLPLRNPAHVFDFAALNKLEIHFDNEQRCADLDAFFAAARSRSVYVQRPRECLSDAGRSMRM